MSVSQLPGLFSGPRFLCWSCIFALPFSNFGIKFKIEWVQIAVALRRNQKKIGMSRYTMGTAKAVCFFGNVL